MKVQKYDFDNNKDILNSKQDSIELNKISKQMVEFINTIEAYDSNTLKKQQKQVKLTSLKSITLENAENFPFKVDFKLIKNKMLGLNVLKQIALASVQKKIQEALNYDETFQLAEQLFWMIFLIAYPEQSQNSTQIVQKLQQNSNQFYFQLLKKVEQEMVISTLIMAITYMIHLAFQTYFKGSSQQFNNRFITNCYNIVLKQLNGIEVNYLYLKSSLEKYFHMQNFLAYKVQRKKEHSPIKLFEIPQDENKKTQNQFFQSLNQNLQPQIKRHSNIMTKVDQFQIEKEYIVEKNIKKKFFNCQQISPTIQSMLQMKDEGLPLKNKRVIKHTSHNKEIDTKYQNKVNNLQKSDLNVSASKSYFQDSMNHQAISNSNYQKLHLFNINSNDIDSSYQQKYPKYSQYFNEELELQSILKKNDMRMSNLRSSQNVYIFYIGNV